MTVGGVMSGRKQHFIPQSLLKGFGKAGKGANVQIVAYSFEHGIFSAATDGVAAKREFYSKLAVEGEGETLDDKITVYETSFTRTLAELRGLDNEGIAETAKTAEFVAHLVVRNDHLRKWMSSAVSGLFSGFAGRIANRDQARSMLGLSGETPSAMLAEQIHKAYADNSAMIAMLGMSREDFAEWAFRQSQLSFDALHAGMIGPIQHVMGKMNEKVPETIADAHRRALGEKLSPEPRIEKLKDFEWRVLHVDTPLILPDCLAVATGAKGEAFSLTLVPDDDEVECLFVPLSSYRLLLGGKPPTGAFNNLNDMFAECAWDFFIAKDRTSELEMLKQRIRIGVSKQVNTIVGNVLSNLERNICV
jgi:hypothetical protein